MNRIVIPVASNETVESRAAVALYRALFPADAVSKRFAVLADSGFVAEATTLSQRVAQRSLTWGTAAEAALRILADDSSGAATEKMAQADGAVAAMRVARGLAEDRRSCRDSWIDGLTDAASGICSATDPSITLIINRSRTYHQRLRSTTLDLEGYLEGLTCHPYVLAGELLRHHALAPAASADVVVEFAYAFGPMYQLVSDLKDAGSASPKSQNRIYAFSDVLEPGGRSVLDLRSRSRSDIRQFATATGRQLLSTTRELGSRYPTSPAMDELLMRANITLRDTARLLKQLG